MNEYTKQELEEAKTALASTLHKCEKMQESGRLILSDCSHAISVLPLPPKGSSTMQLVRLLFIMG